MNRKQFLKYGYLASASLMVPNIMRIEESPQT